MNQILQRARDIIRQTRHNFTTSQQLALAQHIDLLSTDEHVVCFHEIMSRGSIIKAAEAEFFGGPLTAYLAAAREAPTSIERQVQAYLNYLRK